ncbi:MAG: FG-GAP-like repeat-containing protein, partial [Deltaproteobacteria bacterium]
MVGVGNGISYGYENTGSMTSPAWTAKPNWDTPDVGDMAIPDLVDLDADGDLDLIVGHNGGVKVYKNTGSLVAPVWTEYSGWNIPSFGSGKYSFGDLDKDGDLDLLVGSGGATYGYENTGSAGAPAWKQRFGWNSSLVSNYAHPEIADLDNDGNLDLMLGGYTQGGGIVYSYKNNGTLFSYLRSGSFTSRTMDTGGNQEYGKLIFTASLPAQSGSNALKFQLAANNDNSTWSFVGSDDTDSTYFTASGTAIPVSSNGSRYIKYKSYFNTLDQSYTPALNEVSITFSDNTASERVISDVSDNTFEIIRPEITISAPGNAETDPNFRWIAGRSYDIKWQTRGKTSESWTIEGQWLDDLGGLHTTTILDTQTSIASSSFDGTYYYYSYAWTIPATHTLTNNSYVR